MAGRTVRRRPQPEPPVGHRHLPRRRTAVSRAHGRGDSQPDLRDQQEMSQPYGEWPVREDLSRPREDPLKGYKVPGVGISQRGSRLRLVVSARFDPASGKRRQFTRTIPKGTKTEVRRAAQDFLAEVRRREVAEPGQGTLRQYLEEDWLPSVSKLAKTGRPLAPTTAQTYGYEVARICRYIGDVSLGELSVRHVERLRDRLLEEGRCSPRTINETLKHLSRALERARKRGVIPANPADPELVTRLADEGEDSNREPITPQVALDLLAKAAQTGRFEAEVALGLHSLRREEVLGIRWSDIDPDFGGLTVCQTVTCTSGGGLHMGPPKSKKSRRWVPLLPFAAEALRKQQAKKAERRVAFGDAWVDEDLVFDRRDGRPINPSTFSSAWRAWRERVGAVHVGGFHQLRRACASLLRAAGADPKVISEIMGHTDTRLTEQVYTDVWADQKREALQRLAALARL